MAQNILCGATGCWLGLTALAGVALHPGTGVAGEAPAAPHVEEAFLTQHQWQAGARFHRNELLTLLQGPKPDPALAEKLLWAWDCCELLPDVDDVVIDGEEREAFTSWLLAQPALMQTLAAAVRPEDRRAGIFNVLHLLWREVPLGKRVPVDLLTAFAVVYDARLGRGEPQLAQELPTRFRHFLAAGDALRFSPEALPWFLLVYVADTEVSQQERQWALARFGARASPGAVYNAVPYDTNRLRTGSSRAAVALREQGYTLPNILRYGGMCGDQAYFAAQVCKSAGIPAIVLSDRRVATGEPHAWVAAAWRRGRRWAWEEGGRYGAESRYREGFGTDPQTGRSVSEHELALLTERAGTGPDNRRASRFCLVAAQLLDSAGDRRRALTMLGRAVELDPYYADAWLAVATFAADGKIPADLAWQWYGTMLKRFEDYPRFTQRLLGPLRELIGTEDVRRTVALLDLTRKTYARNYPEVAAELMADKADYLHDHGEDRAAVQVYGQAVHEYRQDGPIVEMLLRRAEPVFRDLGFLSGLIELTEDAFKAHQYQRQSASGTVLFSATTFYRLASRLRDLYREIGDFREAERYARRMEQAPGRRGD